MSEPIKSETIKYTKPIKLLLIGESGVGKSCILLRYCCQTFTSTFITTIGIDFKVKKVNVDGTEAKLQIWDTAGQERFRNITLAYFRGAMGIVLVYDITDYHSFQSVHHWMHSINEHACDNVNVILVGNKSDWDETDSTKRKVSYQAGLELSKQYNIDFFETSAKTGANINEVFYSLTKSIIQRLEIENNKNEKLNNGNNKKSNSNINLEDKVNNDNKTGSDCCSGTNTKIPNMKMPHVSKPNVPSMHVKIRGKSYGFGGNQNKSSESSESTESNKSSKSSFKSSFKSPFKSSIKSIKSQSEDEKANNEINQTTMNSNHLNSSKSRMSLSSERFKSFVSKHTPNTLGLDKISRKQNNNITHENTDFVSIDSVLGTSGTSGMNGHSIERKDKQNVRNGNPFDFVSG